MFTQVMVPLDGSPSAEHAIPIARRIARGAGAELSFLRVHIPPESSLMGRATRQGRATATVRRENLRESEVAYLAEVADRAASGFGSMHITTALLEGPVANALATYAEEKGGDLFVMVTRARAGVERFLIGSVAEELVRRTTVPILFVRAGPQLPERFLERGLGDVLVALDGSERAEAILQPARDLASLSGSRLMLLRIAGEAAEPEAERGAEAADAEAYLSAVADRLAGDGLRVETRCRSGKSAAEAIVREARETDSDVIALTTRGRGGATRLAFGSVAMTVLRESPTHILVSRPGS